MPAPSWLALLSPLPPDATVERRPVASAEQLAHGTAGPIAGWQSVIVNLSAPGLGFRNVHVTVDEHGALLSGGDHVMFARETAPSGEVMVSDHESVGGRFEEDGSFHGTHWIMRLESRGDDQDAETTSAVSRPPTEHEIVMLRRIVDDMLSKQEN